MKKRITLLLCLVVVLAGCATGPNPRDPFESMNRKVYAFNDTVDSAVIKPVAKGYKKVMPRPLRTGVSNFFRNLGVVGTTFNDALQGKFDQVPVDIMRFSTNLVFGLGGLLDVATEMRMPYNDEDFGQTLGAWGVDSGPYLVLPFLGPSTARDGAALPVDFYVGPLYAVNEERARWWLLGAYVVDTRANLLDAESFLEQAALDEYSFLRDTWLQRREYLVRDGAVQPVKDNETEPAERPKSLRELEEEEFGDEPVEDDYKPAQ